MKISRKDVHVRKADDSLSIAPLFDGRDFKFDIALGALRGAHAMHINHVSDRVYFILKGSFKVTVGSKTEDGAADDTFVIPAGTPHGISGDGEFLIITAPPFAPGNEERV
jgi:mannose-6-phosphate isomerase-like protein (cupin superfamily)